MDGNSFNPWPAGDPPDQSLTSERESCHGWLSTIRRGGIGDIFMVSRNSGQGVEFDPDRVSVCPTPERSLVSIFTLPPAIDEFINAINTTYDISLAMNGECELYLGRVFPRRLLPDPAPAYSADALWVNRHSAQYECNG